jgi:hypothetical protein
VTNPDVNEIRVLGAQAASSRGFVSAFSLGPQGKRAVWVERRRGSLIREVVVWAKEEGAWQDFGHVEAEWEGDIGLDGKIVFSQGSYDLRGDLFVVVLLL